MIKQYMYKTCVLPVKQMEFFLHWLLTLIN